MIWTRYCGTAAKAGGNGENKHRHAVMEVSCLLEGYPTATTYSRYFFGHTTQPAFNNRIQLYTDDTSGKIGRAHV